jgi:hypothetical protein
MRAFAENAQTYEQVVEVGDFVGRPCVCIYMLTTSYEPDSF